MTYPPPSPYDPNQPSGGSGQPSQPQYGQPSQPQHYTTDADPYTRPDQYSQPSYPNPPMSVAPGSVPPGGQSPYPPTPAYGAGQAFQPGQPAPAPPSGTSNTPLLITLVVVVVAVAAGAIGIGMIVTGGEDEEDPSAADSTTEEESPSEQDSPSPEETPTEEPTTAAAESEYRLPEVDECIENVTEGFYVVPCDSEDAYWEVLHIEHEPDDPDPEDQWHSVAATDSCDGTDWDNYYFTDTAVAAARDWDPDLDSITAIYCVGKME